MTLPKGFHLLLLNGVMGDPALVRRLARSARGVLCADGAVRAAQRLGLSPSVVIGDMDSLPRGRRPPDAAYVFDFDPDRSDFEKCLRWALEAGIGGLCVAGALGGRLDHCLVNLALIERYGRRIDILVADRGLARLLGPGRHRPGLRRGQTFTLLSWPRAARVSLRGARYGLSAERLAPGSRGLSNAARGPVSLTVHSGRVWLIAQ